MRPSHHLHYHAGSKLSWIEAVARDRRTTDFDVRVAVALSSRCGRDGIVRKASQDWIARYVGGTTRGVRGSLVRLIDRGHLGVVAGTRAVGPGHSTEYEMLKKRRNVGSADEPRNLGSETPEPPFQNSGTATPPIPVSSSVREPHARARDEGHRLGPAGARLAKRIGNDKFRSWFGQALIVETGEDFIKLGVPFKFVRTRILEEFYHQTLESFQAVQPSVKRIDIDVVEAFDATQVDPDEAGR